MTRLLIVAGALAGFGYVLQSRNIDSADLFVWLLPTACAASVAWLWS